MSDDPVTRFLRWAELDRRRSDNTLARYRAVLSQLSDPASASVDDIQLWWDSRLHLSEATRANELACLRAFYKWCGRFDVRPDDPTRRLHAPDIPNRVPRPIGESDLKKLFELTEPTPELRRAVALGAYAGLRVSEAAALDWSNIDIEARRIYVRGKGRKERVFGLSPLLLDKLLPEAGGNVIMAGGEPVRGDTLQRRINRLMERNDIDCTFHDLRKRGATMAAAKTGDINAVAQAFGWSSIETAASYVRVSDEALDKIAEAMA